MTINLHLLLSEIADLRYLMKVNLNSGASQLLKNTIKLGTFNKPSHEANQVIPHIRREHKIPEEAFQKGETYLKLDS